MNPPKAAADLTCSDVPVPEAHPAGEDIVETDPGDLTEREAIETEPVPENFIAYLAPVEPKEEEDS